MAMSVEEEKERFLGQREELEVDKLFRVLVKLEGSDLHLKVDLPPYVRVNGTLRPLNRGPVGDEEMVRLVFPMMNQRSRRIFNEADLLRALRGRFPDLEWVVFDLLSAADTARLFAKAAVIAGPHGAGFANMLFSGSGTQIIEFMPLEQPNLCYWHLAEMLGNPYLMIPGRSDRTRSMVAELGPDNCGAIGR